MPENIITDFPVTLYGNLEKYSETISKARCRIFYKGGNRNGTYITDEFAEKLLAEKKVAVVPGDAFGESGKYFIRCSYAYSMKSLILATDKIREFVESLNK